MKTIERFLNHLYFAVYHMTYWLAFEPTRRQEEYERSLELTCVLHGLSFLCIIDCIALIKLIIEYVSGYNIPSLLGESLFLFCFVAIIIIVDSLVFHYFVYRKKKYLAYCKEFEKESKTTKYMWCMLVVLLYILAGVILVGIFSFGHTHLAKPT